MTEEDLLNDIMATKLDLEDVIIAHKLEQDPVAKENLKVEYCKMLNSYYSKQNNYRNYKRYENE